MKKLRFLLISIICTILLPLSVHAASASISVSSTNKVVVGNKVTVTVTLSSATPIGSWEMLLNYDKSYLQLTSSTAEGGGSKMVGYTSTTSGVSKKSYTFTFKALKTGSTKVYVGSYDVVANDMSSMSVSAGSKTISIITQAELEASYSKNNDLRSLEVEGYTISPEFNKDTLEYKVVVPEGTKEINIIANASDSKSSISGSGILEVTGGQNSFAIVVRAENGSEKTYTINVEVKDEFPINVSVNKSNYTVVKLRENLPASPLYQEYTVNINDFEIPAYKNEATGIVLVGLKDDSGNIDLFIYDEDNNTYKVYNEIGLNKITIYPMDTTEELKGYKKDIITINNAEVNCYIYNKDSNFVIIYGINIETGEKGFYMYDKVSQALIKYNDEYINDLNNELNLYTYIIIGFIVILIIMFILLIKKRKPKKKKVNDGKKEKQDKKDNEIIEIDKKEDNIVYDKKEDK